MQIKHPYANLNKRLTPPEAVLKYVAAAKEPPTIHREDKVKPYWKEQQLAVTVKNKKFPMGVVPAGDYTNPDTKEAKALVLGLYKALKGTPISRHLVAVALNFQVSDDVDTVRDGLKEDGVVGKDIEAGGRGKSVRWMGVGAVAPEPKAKAPKAEAKAKNGDKTPAKGTARPPAGSGPAKRAAKAAAAAKALADPVPDVIAANAPAPEPEPEREVVLTPEAPAPAEAPAEAG
jgi:hypothetical protein